MEGSFLLGLMLKREYCMLCVLNNVKIKNNTVMMLPKRVKMQHELCQREM